MKNVFVCGCFKAGNEIYKKKYDEILWGNFPDFVKIVTETSLYICCPKIICFCYKVNRWFFFNKLCNDISCISLLKFGNRRICQICLYPLQVKLFPFLMKIRW